MAQKRVKNRFPGVYAQTLLFAKPPTVSRAGGFLSAKKRNALHAPFIVSIVSKLRRHLVGEAITSPNGVAGFIFYLGAVGLVLDIEFLTDGEEEAAGENPEAEEK